MKNLYSSNANTQLGNYDKLYKEHCEANDIKYDPNNIYDWLDDALNQEWNNFLENIAEDQEDLRVLVTGTFMAWNGPQKGGKIFKTLKDAVSGMLLEDSTFNFYIDDKKNFCVDEWHHDSPVVPNHYEFKYITAKGEKWLETHGESHSAECHDGLLTGQRTKKVMQ